MEGAIFDGRSHFRTLISYRVMKGGMSKPYTLIHDERSQDHQ